MFEILASSTRLTSELLARTSSTMKVQEIVQLSLAPVFLLGAIGAFLNVMNSRLIWITEQLDRLQDREEKGLCGPAIEDFPVLKRRRQYAHRAINLSTGAALLICAVVAVMFLSGFVRPALGTLVAGAWITAMILVFASLLFFLMETRLATKSSVERIRISHEVREREADNGRV